MAKVRHVLGISGGKDSAALALFLKSRHPELDIEYYTSDTGRELDETYALIERLNSALGKPILRIDPIKENHTNAPSNFDHFLELYGGYLPSSMARWCTKKLKLEPFEEYIGEVPTISYVGIRGDEDREGYISKKPNVQSIFPFRENIWSEDVTKKVLANSNRDQLLNYYREILSPQELAQAEPYISKAISASFTQKQKLESLLRIGIKEYNQVVFQYLKTTDYPVGKLDHFPLVDNEEVIRLTDVFRILDESGVGAPEYYRELEYEVEIDGELKKGTYARSRSGCFFCFYQQKIEWVWLLEQHPDLFAKAMTYEQEGYTWMQEETLSELSQPERIAAIKKEHYIRTHRIQAKSQQNWQDEILAAEGVGCASCFI
ncbi:3'-phosphoadenosine 5'-phosphosulfate sulfotransferase (PAPS reductase)/FAD synthetase and related enzymes [Aquiflexum balticum DSM 16537]|uniref:3'-phosphoadenosine 5'-phosphosulfate sulfotransferase (PAPS reductase)/FAD synthetase and related enzymes n=1 Tax=Aquiflexum balticum DSM 16537 TaxID=758820 RepID=A0A1W2H1R2_9BACT|nr:phosphoadenosine phosphosulfate reductase family protein [Aquiflexum balticum]SMD42426.1 3'-phosphoadenosine 5'-phosphosulfate sulfotransferase (PAPS reductase)/FAD synthetase and related enzymes [Aquiflexum balticum DSM 16537]